MPLCITVVKIFFFNQNFLVKFSELVDNPYSNIDAFLHYYGKDSFLNQNSTTFTWYCTWQSKFAF